MIVQLEPALAYLALKAAQKQYDKALPALAKEEFARVHTLAQQQFELETAVLRSADAGGVVVPAATVDTALQEIRGRYADEAEFTDDLARNGLTPGQFADALTRELRVDAVMEKVASRAVKVSDMDVELYYLYHPDQFRRPETREARHILITLNDTMPDNTRPVARQRLEAIAQRLAKNPSRFEEQALKHSECPTSLQGGVLGDMPRGKLFPELDAALFELPAGALSGILESEIGFHLLRCDAIHPAKILDLNESRPHIRNLMMKKRKRVCQQGWLKGVLGGKN